MHLIDARENPTSTRVSLTTLSYGAPQLSWNTHVTNKTAQATNVLCSVRRTLGSTWGLAPRLTFWAYKALVLPILEYGSVVWVGAVRKYWITTALTKVQRLACCTITSAFPSGLPRDAHQLHGGPSKPATTASVP